jgi:hypothetical protein
MLSPGAAALETMAEYEERVVQLFGDAKQIVGGWAS